MSFTCRKCGGLALDESEKGTAWGYGGPWCYCEVASRPAPFTGYEQTLAAPPLTPDDVRRIVDERIRYWLDHGTPSDWPKGYEP